MKFLDLSKGQIITASMPITCPYCHKAICTGWRANLSIARLGVNSHLRSSRDDSYLSLPLRLHGPFNLGDGPTPY